MKISLIIPAYNEEKYISSCLNSIEEHADKLFEIIVIDNASTDKTNEIAKKFNNVRVIYEPQKGLPFARNRGLKEAGGEIVAFIDADTKMPKNWISKIKKEFEKNHKLVSISGPYIYHDVSYLKKYLVWIYWTILGYPAYLITGYMAVLGNFAAKRDSLLQIGGFNNEILFYGDDTDISKRLKKIGKVKFVYNFYMFTSARRLKKEGLLNSAFKYIINYVWVAAKNKPKTKHYENIR